MLYASGRELRLWSQPIRDWRWTISLAAGETVLVMTINASPAVAGAPVVLCGLARRHARLMRRLTAWHARIVRGTRGRLGTRWFGTPVLLLETAGRHTGQRRIAPLVYLRDGDDLVVVPANAGALQAPAWWLNLQAAGDGVAILGSARHRVAPVVLEGARRERLWRRFVAVSPVEHYQHQTTRTLPVVALTALPDAPRPAVFRELRAHDVGWRPEVATT